MGTRASSWLGRSSRWWRSFCSARPPLPPLSAARQQAAAITHGPADTSQPPAGPVPPLAEALGLRYPSAEGSAGTWAIEMIGMVAFGVGAAAGFVPTLPAMERGVAHLGADATDVLSAAYWSVYYLGEGSGPFVGEHTPHHGMVDRLPAASRNPGSWRGRDCPSPFLPSGTFLVDALGPGWGFTGMAALLGATYPFSLRPNSTRATTATTTGDFSHSTNNAPAATTGVYVIASAAAGSFHHRHRPRRVDLRPAGTAGGDDTATTTAAAEGVVAAEE